MGSSTDENSHGDVDVEKAGPAVAVKDDTEPELPDWRKVCLIMLAVYLSMFLVALVGDPISVNEST